MSTNPEIPYQLREARRQAGMTQVQAASLCGVSVRTWRRWESDSWTPPPTRADALRTLDEYVQGLRVGKSAH